MSPINAEDLIGCRHHPPGPPSPGAPVIANGHLTAGTLIGHLLMIGQAVLLFYGKYPAPLMWVISIAASVGLAWVFYLAIERPSKAASRAVRSQAIVNSSAPPAP